MSWPYARDLNIALGPGNGTSGLAHDQLGSELPVHGWRFAFFDGCVYTSIIMPTAAVPKASIG